MGQMVLNGINYLGDHCGCGMYRQCWPTAALHTLINSQIQFRITETLTPILDQRYYMAEGGIRIVRLQRWFGKDKEEIMLKFLKPLSQQLGFWLVYEIDDVLLHEEIPQYNLARPYYDPARIGNSVQNIMSACDIITVTTQELADIYHEKLNIPKEKFLVIPNYLPRWWADGIYNYDRQMALYKKTKNKPRVAMACSTNHFDVENKNNGIDDFSSMIPWIEHHIKADDIQFIFVGGFPKQLEQYVKDKKVEFQPPSVIYNYPKELPKRGIDLLLAPLIDNRFNQCKSNIKWLEFSAVGIPMFGQNICTYNKYTDQVFNNNNDLENIVNKLFWQKNSEKYYSDIITKNRDLIDKGDKFETKGYWLEDNIQKYVNLYSMAQKTIEINI